MAITQSPVYNISVALVDRDKNVGTMSMHSASSQDLGILITALTTFIIPAIQAISNAVVKSWSITASASDDAAVASAPEESDVERKGVFSFRAVDGSAYVLSVPSIKNTLVIDDSNLIDKTNVDVIAFLNMVATPTLLDLATLRTYLGSDIIFAEKARKHHRGSTRG